MNDKKFNHVAAIIFAISLIAAGALFAFGLSLNPSFIANASQTTLDESIIDAQGTNVYEISTDVPETVSEQMNEKLVDLLDEKEQTAETNKAHMDEQRAEEKAILDAAFQKQAQNDSDSQDFSVQQPQETTLDTTRQHYATVTGTSGHTEVSEQINGSLSNETPDQAPNTINMLGETIPFIDAYDVTRAPEHGCGIWKGDDLVDDGQYAYFVGHNPGDFHNVMNLRDGNLITVCDSNGNMKTYVVHDVFTVPQKSTYGDIANRVEGHGESIVLQTCCGDNINVRIVVAW